MLCVLVERKANNPLGAKAELNFRYCLVAIYFIFILK